MIERMKTEILLIIAISFLLGSLAGCGNLQGQPETTTNVEETAGVAEENTMKSEGSTTETEARNTTTVGSTTESAEISNESPSLEETSSEDKKWNVPAITTTQPASTKKPEAVTMTTKKATEKITTTQKIIEKITTTKKQEQTTTSDKIRVGTNEQKLWVLDGINIARRESGKWEVPRQLDPYLTAQAQAYAEKLAKANEGHAVHSDWDIEGVAVNWIFLEEPEEQWVGHGELMCMHVGGFVEGLYFGVGIAAASDGTTYTVVQSAKTVAICDEDGNGILFGTYTQWMDLNNLYPDIASVEEYLWAGYPYIYDINGIRSTTDFIK